MSTTTPPQGAARAPNLLDRSDVRVKHAEGFGGAVSAFVDRIRSGDLGALPVIATLGWWRRASKASRSGRRSSR